MIVIGGAVLGAILGGTIAKRRGGTRLDIAQYAASMGIAFALIGLVSTILIHRAAV